jgi:hypothetical protein
LHSRDDTVQSLEGFAQSGVEVILDCVVRPSAELRPDDCPFVAELVVQFEKAELVAAGPILPRMAGVYSGHVSW